MAQRMGESVSRQMEIDSEMRDCIRECQSCAAICLETVTHCLQMSGAHAEVSHIRTLLDCADICQTAANFMLRGSDLHTRTCAVCSEACERCAVSCEQFPDDRMMQQCAEECRRCATSCRNMATRAVHA